MTKYRKYEKFSILCTTGTRSSWRTSSLAISCLIEIYFFIWFVRFLVDGLRTSINLLISINFKSRNLPVQKLCINSSCFLSKHKCTILYGYWLNKFVICSNTEAVIDEFGNHIEEELACSGCGVKYLTPVNKHQIDIAPIINIECN